MQEQFNKSMHQMQQFAEPAQRFGYLMLDHAEKVAHLNIEAARDFSRMAIEQMRAAMEVRDPETMQKYLNSQNNVMQTVSNKLSEDATALADINKNMGEEVQKLAQENASRITENVKEKTKPAPAEKAKSTRASSASGSSAANSSAASSSSSASGSGNTAKKST